MPIHNDRLPRFSPRIADTMAQTHRNYKPQVVLVILAITVLIGNYYFLGNHEKKKEAEATEPAELGNSDIRIVTVSIAANSSVKCEIEPWNNVTNESFSYLELRTKWRKDFIGRWGNIYNASLRPVAAFVYEQEIVVTTATQNRYGKQVYCRYFDCNRNELPDSAFATHMFPVTSAYCARRAGAKFMGLTDTKDELVNDPVPITFRAYQKPIHEVSVCVGPIYGEERRWLEIVETTEHHILMGIDFFYFTVLNNVDAYTRMLLDDYEQLGRAEVTIIQNEYKTMDWMFHMMQITECFFRSRHHSKWILNLDIDERLVMTQMPLQSFIQTIPNDVGEVSFSTIRVQRTKELPKVFSGQENLKGQLLFLNYNNTVFRSFSEMKGLLRPDKTEAMFYHFTWAQYPGFRVMSASRKMGHARHFRTTLPSLAKTWSKDLNFYTSRLDPKFEGKLLEAIARRVERVYDQRPVWCEEVTQHLLTIFSADNYNCIWKQNGTRFSG